MFKTIIISSFLFSAAHFSTACDNISANKKLENVQKADKITSTETYGKLDTAYFASGCFWCTEAIFESLRGVKDAVSGYAGGQTKNPTYEQVCTHTTGHAESVMVLYDPQMIPYSTLLKVYFASCDPTQVEGQGPDHGSPYRSVIFYRNQEEDKAATAYKEVLNKSGKYSRPIAVAIEAYTNFYKAEDYHQGYEKLHPDNPYVQNVSIPRIHNMQKQFPELLKKD
jgi:peptide-methionine (S)-S-oxide reductase